MFLKFQHNIAKNASIKTIYMNYNSAFGRLKIYVLRKGKALFLCIVEQLIYYICIRWYILFVVGLIISYFNVLLHDITSA